MKTKQELFEELLGILNLCYDIQNVEHNKVLIKPLEADYYSKINFDDGLITVILDSTDKVWVSKIEDLASVGLRIIDIENFLIEGYQLNRSPIALTIYLYYTLLGLLWSTRTSKELQNEDPKFDQGHAYTELIGLTPDGKELIYVYRASIDSRIILAKYTNDKALISQYSFSPIDYINDPTSTVEKFFDFFSDIVSIVKAGRG